LGRGRRKINVRLALSGIYIGAERTIILEKGGKNLLRKMPGGKKVTG